MNQPNALQRVRRDLYQHVTNSILEDLERGVHPWFKSLGAGPMSEVRSCLAGTTVSVPGVNVLLLWSEALRAVIRQQPGWRSARRRSMR